MIGVYLLMANKKVIYVGATECWPMRLTQHKEIIFTEARLFQCDKKDLLEFEKRFISFFKPTHNFKGKLKHRKKISDKWICDNRETIKDLLESRQDNELAEKARNEFDLSPKYTTTDITSVIVRRYCFLMNCDYNYRKDRFINIKKS